MTDFDSDINANTTSMKGLMRWFVWSALAICVGVGSWSVLAKLDSAVVTSGTFVVKSSAQTVQHPEGGVIGEILVKDGQRVDEGQVLVRLSAAKVIAEQSILERKLIFLSAERARLEAERDDRPEIQPPLLASHSPEAARDMTRALLAQSKLMDERRSVRASHLSQLGEHKAQVETQIAGLKMQVQATKDELVQVSADLTDQRHLDVQRLIRRTVLRQTEREASRLKGSLGDAEARIASARSQLLETEFKVAETVRSARSDILGQLQKVTGDISETSEQLIAARDRLQRLDIRAPRTGSIHELSIHTTGGVISSGQTVMKIIPTNEPLVVSAKIPPEEVDQVHVGQPATVKISAFRLVMTPELDGEVVRLSADQERDERTGKAFFSATISIAAGERAKLGDKELVPGLPAEVLIRGESRRVITYLTQPLTDKIGLAFREK